MNEGSQRRPKAGVRMTDVPVGASRPIHDRLVPTGTPVIPPALRAVRPRAFSRSDHLANQRSSPFRLRWLRFSVCELRSLRHLRHPVQTPISC